jgi:transcriptional regulator with XRE-family HTH domain
MDDIKRTIAKNIVRLRRASGMTQLELAEKLNYSDKAVSKWERGDSIPDIVVLKEIADLFGIKVDDLLQEERTETAEEEKDAEEAAAESEEEKGRHYRNRQFITGMSILLVWLIATLCFVLVEICSPTSTNHWLAFVCAVPISCIVWLVFNSVWFNVRYNFFIISLLMWTVLITICLAFQPYGRNTWLLLVAGIPGQAIICLWSRIRRKKIQ